MTESETLYNDISALLDGIGVKLVEFGVSRRKGSTQLRAVILGSMGTGIGECSKAHKLMQPRLEALLGEEDFYLEVASPGIDRVLKSNGEFAVFGGRGVRVHLKDGGEPVMGTISASDGESVSIATKAGTHIIRYDDIQKAKLDYSQEGV